MKRLKLFLLTLAFFSVASLPLSAQSYYITEEQLQAIENESKMQKELVQKLQIQLEELNKSAQMSENRNLMTSVTVGAVTFTVGFALGAGLLCLFNSKR